MARKGSGLTLNHAVLGGTLCSKYEGLQNRANHPLLLSMKRDSERLRKDVAAHRARQIAAGRIALTTYLPTDLLSQIDQLKQQRGVSGRATIIEEALRLYIENAQRA